jgi:hypothetical protein
VRALFARPAEPAFGENANAAAERFGRAINRTDASMQVEARKDRTLRIRHE